MCRLGMCRLNMCRVDMCRVNMCTLPQRLNICFARALSGVFMHLKPKKERKIDLWENVDVVLTSESIRYALWLMSRFSLKDKAGWCSAQLKKVIPDVEIYIDSIAGAVAEYLRERGKLTEDNLVKYIVRSIEHTVLHELTHLFSGELDDVRVENAVNAVLDDTFMVWSLIPCPKKDGEPVTWVECLSCTDAEKHPTCPLHRIRVNAYPRQYKLGVYHVTELLDPRYSYFERTVDYAKKWDDYWNLFFGVAVGHYVESLYANHKQEVDLEVVVAHDEDGEPVTVVGHADIIDEDVGWIMEIKCYHSLTHIVRRGRADPRHEFQVRAYWTLLKKSEKWRWMTKRIKKVRVIYFGRTGTRRYREFDVPLEEVDVVTPALILHRALKTGVPPRQKCAEWRCRFCPLEIKKKCLGVEA